MRIRSTLVAGAAALTALVAAPGLVGHATTTYTPVTETEQYFTPGEVFAGCGDPTGVLPTYPVPSQFQNLGGGCFVDVQKQLTAGATVISAISFKDAQITGVDGEYSFTDASNNNIQGAFGSICNDGQTFTDSSGATVPSITIPTNAATMYVFVGNVLDYATNCAKAGQPVATQGTVSITYS